MAPGEATASGAAVARISVSASALCATPAFNRIDHHPQYSGTAHQLDAAIDLLESYEPSRGEKSLWMMAQLPLMPAR